MKNVSLSMSRRRAEWSGSGIVESQNIVSATPKLALLSRRIDSRSKTLTTSAEDQRITNSGSDEPSIKQSHSLAEYGWSVHHEEENIPTHALGRLPPTKMRLNKIRTLRELYEEGEKGRAVSKGQPTVLHTPIYVHSPGSATTASGTFEPLAPVCADEICAAPRLMPTLGRMTLNDELIGATNKEEPKENSKTVFDALQEVKSVLQELHDTTQQGFVESSQARIEDSLTNAHAQSTLKEISSGLQEQSAFANLLRYNHQAQDDLDSMTNSYLRRMVELLGTEGPLFEVLARLRIVPECIKYSNIELQSIRKEQQTVSSSLQKLEKELKKVNANLYDIVDQIANFRADLSTSQHSGSGKFMGEESSVPTTRHGDSSETDGSYAASDTSTFETAGSVMPQLTQNHIGNGIECVERTATEDWKYTTSKRSSLNRYARYKKDLLSFGVVLAVFVLCSSASATIRSQLQHGVSQTAYKIGANFDEYTSFEPGRTLHARANWDQLGQSMKEGQQNGLTTDDLLKLWQNVSIQ